MNYIKLPEKIYPYTPQRLVKDNPNTSFPKELGDDVLLSHGVYPVKDTVRPEFDKATQAVDELFPHMNEDGWEQRWAVRELTQEELYEPCPVSVTPRQARIALALTNRLAAVETWVANHPNPLIRIEFDFASEIRRDSPLIAMFAASESMTEEEIDALFRLAACLPQLYGQEQES